MQTNENIIKVVGLANIAEELANGKDYNILAEASCVEVAEKSNHDGSVNKIYKLKMFGEIKINETGHTPLLGKIKGYTPSQKLRFALKRNWNIQNEGLDFDEYYEKRINEFIEEVNQEIE